MYLFAGIGGSVIIAPLADKLRVRRPGSEKVVLVILSTVSAVFMSLIGFQAVDRRRNAVLQVYGAVLSFCSTAFIPVRPGARGLR